MVDQGEFLSSAVAKVWSRRDNGTRGNLIGHTTLYKTGTMLASIGKTFPIGESRLAFKAESLIPIVGNTGSLTFGDSEHL